MTQGYMLMGVDREDDSTRIDAAYLAALTLKIADPEREICVMVRDTEELPDQYEHAFDYAVEMPYDQLLEFRSEPRVFAWQPYYCTPFEETILITEPALAIDEMDQMWIGLEKVDLAFATARDFQDNPAKYQTKFVRQEKNAVRGFVADIIFFRKSERAAEFFKMADIIFKEWEEVYEQIVPEKKPTWFDYTLVTNTVAHLLGERYDHSGTGFEFTDFEPDTISISKAEGEKTLDWAEQISIWFDGTNVKINNHRQHGLFVYHTPDIITEEARNGISRAYQEARSRT